MIRIAVAIVVIAAAACNRASSLRDIPPQPAVATDSNYVTEAELQEDVRQGYSTLYDALKSTRPELLRSASERRWPLIYFDNPLGFFHGPFTDIAVLQSISTARVKWIRRYSSATAPSHLGSYESFDQVLVVALR